MTMSVSRRALAAAALAGLISGVLATVPLLGLALNCLCCASVWGAAAAVVLWENRRRGAAMSLRHGALLGLITGVVSGLTAAAFIVLLTFEPREAAQIVREMSDARGDADQRAASDAIAAALESGVVTAAVAAFTAALHTGVGVLSGLASAALTAADKRTPRNPAS